MSQYQPHACISFAADLVRSALDDLAGSQSDQAAAWLLTSPIAGLMLARLGLCGEDIPALVERIRHTCAMRPAPERSRLLEQNNYN